MDAIGPILPLVSIIVASVSAVGSAVAAMANFAGLQMMRAQGEAGIFESFRNRYRSQEMRDAVLALAAFGRKEQDNPEVLKSDFEALESTDKGSKEVLHRSLRVVGAYFEDLIVLQESELISRSLLITLTRVPGLNVFYIICLPLFSTWRASDDSLFKRARYLRRIVSKYGDGLVF